MGDYVDAWSNLSWDICSWKRQLEKNENLESFKLVSLKLEGLHSSWKVPIEVRKFSMQY